MFHNGNAPTLPFSSEASPVKHPYSSSVRSSCFSCALGNGASDDVGLLTHKSMKTLPALKRGIAWPPHQTILETLASR